MSRLRAIGVAAMMPLAAACTPSARVLRGTATHATLPPTRLSAKPTLIKFTWTYKDETFEANGDGVVRVGPPDRARLDFFLKNGMTGGYAILLRDSLEVPGIDLIRRFLPPVPLLWSALGRLALPSTRDTVVRVDGDTLRADLGDLHGRDASTAAGPAWRLAYVGTTLARVERIEGGRIIEWVTRRRNNLGQWDLQYAHEGARRRLGISVTDTTTVEGFDDAIWRRP